MAKITPINTALAFLALALGVHAYSAGEWATAGNVVVWR